MDSVGEASLGPSTSHFEAILHRIRGGDEAAKDEMIHDAYPRALRLTRFILRGDIGEIVTGQTDHVCSVSYEKFARKLKEGMKRDFANLREMFGYLDRIIRNTALDEVRHLLGPKFQIQFPQSQLPIHHVGDIGTRLRFYEMVEDLPDDERCIIELKYQRDYNDAEIAEFLQISRTTVARKLIKAMMRLKKDFDEPVPNGAISS